MHTTTVPAGRISETSPTYYMIHNGDYSGDVQIFRSRTQAERESLAAKNMEVRDQQIYEGPFALLEEFVGMKGIDSSISALEQLSGREFLRQLAIARSDL